MGITQWRGRAGETMAAAYLELAGCEVLQRNVRQAGVEIDLLASEAGTRLLVEVKVRNRSDFGGAALAVDRTKRERLRRAARTLAKDGAPVRIDVVAIQLEEDGAVVRHYRNAVTE